MDSPVTRGGYDKREEHLARTREGERRQESVHRGAFLKVVSGGSVHRGAFLKVVSGGSGAGIHSTAQEFPGCGHR